MTYPRKQPRLKTQNMCHAYILALTHWSVHFHPCMKKATTRFSYIINAHALYAQRAFSKGEVAKPPLGLNKPTDKSDCQFIQWVKVCCAFLIDLIVTFHITVHISEVWMKYTVKLVCWAVSKKDLWGYKYLRAFSFRTLKLLKFLGWQLRATLGQS